MLLLANSAILTLVKTILLIVPLGLDTFAVSAAIGMAGLPASERRRLSLVFASFELVMPLVGFAAGYALGAAIGRVADYAAVILLIAVGAHILLFGEEDEVTEVRSASAVHGSAIIALGLSISLDELAIGFTIGLLGLPLLVIVALIGIQAFIAAQLGHRLGTRLEHRYTERAEQLAGTALILLGLGLLADQLA